MMVRTLSDGTGVALIEAGVRRELTPSLRIERDASQGNPEDSREPAHAAGGDRVQSPPGAAAVGSARWVEGGVRLGVGGNEVARWEAVPWECHSGGTPR